jgi:septum formation protein
MGVKIILASGSSARRELLKKFNLPFEVVMSDYKEDMTLPLPPAELARHLSQGKALSVARQYPEAIVIAADTFIVFKNVFLGKPKDSADARKTLSNLSGNTHTILTGLAVIKGGKSISKVISSEVKMKKLTKVEINDYIGTGEALGKAGSYALQGKGKELIENIVGDYFNVMGLPIEALARILKNEFAIPVQFPEH